MDLQSSDIANTRRPVSLASDLSAHAAEQADMAIGATKRAADNAAQSVHAGLDNLQERVPSMLTHAGAATDEFLTQGVQRARAASSAVRETTGRAQERAVVYIRDEPLKSMLLAAGVGALLALLLSGRSGR